jgi:tetratricopeptide (TPR) repeat protein
MPKPKKINRKPFHLQKKQSETAGTIKSTGTITLTPVSNEIYKDSEVSVSITDTDHSNQIDDNSYDSGSEEDVEITHNLNILYESSEPIEGKNLCLNMIVKNESRVIKRLLQSVVKYIDCYCICDTGSTDNTVDEIRNFFESQTPPIPGRIILEPFQDFGYNRSFALKACDDLDVSYILLLDADMVLSVNPKYTKEDIYGKLRDDVYYLFQGSDNFYYKNVRIVRNHAGISYWGVTHEYVKTPEGSVYNKFDKNEIFINDIGDGGCKSDKFIRDINLLKKGLEKEKNNDRYTFYLANSYRDAGQSENAIETYKKRIELGGWIEEVWQSYYNIGKCYKKMGDMANAIYWWSEGFNHHPKRLENMYEIIHHYRCIGKNNLAYMYYVAAEQINRNPVSDDHLFLQKDIYEYKLDYELSIIGYYCNWNNYDLVKCCTKVMNNRLTEESILRNVLSNYKFYSKKLIDIGLSLNELQKKNMKLLENIGKDLPVIKNANSKFFSSTPSVCISKEGELLVNVRYVNYWINDKGGYENPGNISTINVVAKVDITEDEWRIVDEFVLDYDRSHDNLYVGLEDVRLFKMSNDDRMFFNANRGLSYHNIIVEHGYIDMEQKMVVSGFVSMDKQRDVEKNWVLFEDGNGKMKIIYNWNPILIGDMKNEENPLNKKFIKTHTITPPHIFKHLRGSTNGVTIGNEVWFMCHVVSYEDRRYYYHLFVVLNAYTYEVVKYSPLFTINKNKVEYSLGFVYFKEKNEFLLGYSVMDKATEYMSVSKERVDEMMFVV